MEITAAIDFFTVPTFTFKILFCFVVLSHDRRKILHFNVTEYPTAEWAIQQIREAFPYDEAPKYLLRDRDSIYSAEFREKVKNMGIEHVPSAPQSPWQNPYAERVIGTIRRECLDHMVIFSENHLRRIMKEFIDYYNNVRPHQSLENNSPVPRRVDPPENGKVISIPMVGGLHHEYKRAA